MNHFKMMKSFLSNLIRHLAVDINSGQTRVGFVNYGAVVDHASNLNVYSSLKTVLKALSSLSYSGGTAHTAGALQYVRTQMLTSAAGDRRDIRNVVVVLTDGRSDHSGATKVCTMWKLMKKAVKSFLISGTIFNTCFLSWACCIKYSYTVG